MAVAEEPFILGPKNEEEYDAFFRLLERGTDFSLAFVFCDDKSIEAEIRRRLTVHYPIKELSVPPDTYNIYQYLEDFSPQLENNDILFVHNLHQLIEHSDQAQLQLGNLNLRRDLLPKIFSSPVIFWLSIGDEAAFIHNAPDFWSWRGACFYFYPHYPDREFIPEVDQPGHQSDFYQKILQEITLLKQEIREIEQTVPQTVSLKKKQAGKRLELSDKFRDLLKYSAARKEIQKADSLYQEVGSLQGEANCLQGLAKIKMAQKKYPEAKKYLEKAKEYYQKIGDQHSLGNNHCLMGDLFQEQGLTSEALREYRAALKLFRRIGLKRETGIIENLMNKLT